MNKIPRWLPGLIVSLVLIGAILYFVDLRAVAAAMRNANYTLLLVSLMLGVLWMFGRAKVWSSLLQDKAPYKEVFFALNEGYLLNNFLPFRLGEVGRAFLLGRKTGRPFLEIFPTVIIERVTDLAFTAAILASAVPFVVGAESAQQTAFIIGGLVVLGLVTLFFLARNAQWALDLFHKFSARWSRLQQLGGGFLESFFAGLAVLTDARVFARFLFWMSLNWALAILQYYILILAFFPQAEIVWSMFGLGAAAFGGAIPALPGAIGTLEGAFGGALTLLTGDQATGLAVALMARLYNYLTSVPFGAYGLSREGETLGHLYRELTNLRAGGNSKQ